MTLSASRATPPAAPRNEAKLAASESLEDYTLRFAPRSYRKWAPGVVATSALGGIAYLADFSIGANIGIAHGTANGILGILVAALIIFATFTFIFFALEGSIMAQGLYLGLGVPRPIGYLVSTVLIFPLVIYGMKVLAKLQVSTTPLWLLLMVIPVGYLIAWQPDSVADFFAYTGEEGEGANFASVMLAAGVCLSLIAQIAEQIDYLRFMPPRTPENKRSWWTAVILAGPGWVIFGAAKQIIGMFLAVYLISNVPGALDFANEPVQQFLATYQQMMPQWLALLLAVVLVVISQVKINVTNAYSGSLAWTNSYTRITKRYPGRITFLVVNLLIALALMELNMFDFLNAILSFYANLAMSWICVVAADIAINKYLLRLSPKVPEFRRGMLYDWNPVGIVSLLLSGGTSIAIYFGAFGAAVQPFSPLFAVGIAIVSTPLMAIATRGRFYLRRTNDGIDLPMFDEHGNPSGETLRCHVTDMEFERPDMIASAMPGENGEKLYLSSLALSTDRLGEHILPAEPRHDASAD